jgi:hypothetical protein
MTGSLKTKEFLPNIGITIISFTISFFILMGLTNIGDKYSIPFLTSWSMFHVTIFFLFPVMAVVVFIAVRKAFDLFFLGKMLQGKIEYRTSRKAMISFILSCLGFIPFLSLPGVIYGHRALKEIRSSANIRGSGLAITGLVFGYFWLLWSICFICVGIYLLCGFGSGVTL